MPAYPDKREKGNDIDELVDDIDEFDPELKPPAINTVSQAEGLAEQLKDFVQYYGHEELSLTLRANARNVRLYYPYWQYTELCIFRFVLYSAYAAHYVY